MHQSLLSAGSPGKPLVLKTGPLAADVACLAWIWERRFFDSEEPSEEEDSDLRKIKE